MKNKNRQKLNQIIDHVNTVLLSKKEQVKLAFTCIFSNGHLLLNDIPGTGKTTLAKSLASSLGMEMKRVQFTSDLMPSDILGVSIYEPLTGHFSFHKGPIFTNIFLADEINRASSRTQSALLEVMAEGQVSIDGDRYEIEPLFVIATQNPYDSNGTNMLPQAQKDRFMMTLSLGYPDEEDEKAMMLSGKMDRQKEFLEKMDFDTFHEIQKEIQEVTVTEELIHYAHKLVVETRNNKDFICGLSPRASITMIQAAKTYAYISNRHFVTPDDIKTIFIPCNEHRLQSKNHISEKKTLQDIIDKIGVISNNHEK